MPGKKKNSPKVSRLPPTPPAQPTPHRKDKPPYQYDLDVPCTDAVNAKIFVIDDGTHSTMLLADEY